MIHWLRQRIFQCRPQLSAGATRAERGRYGEDLAAWYCRRELGYRVVIRNWSYQRDELDIVCVDGEVLVFIEVRARSEHAQVGGFHSVDAKKKQILRRCCANYIKQLPKRPKHFRFDVIEVVLQDTNPDLVRHYANVPLFNKHFS